MLIEVIGINPSNKGAMMMLETIEDRLKNQLSNNIEVVFRLNRRSDLRLIRERNARFRLAPSRHKFGFLDLGKYLPKVLRRQARIVTVSEIDCFLDASGFAYGDQWTYRMARYSAKLAKLASKKSKPYIMMPQAFGPFKTRSSRYWTSKLLANASLIFSRDKTSYSEVDSLKVDTEHHLSPDVTINYSRSTLTNVDVSNKVCLIPNEKVFSDVKSVISRFQYLNTLECIIKYFSDINIEVFILNHEGKSDREICEQLSKNNNLELIDYCSQWEAKSILSKSYLVLSSRFHGCVSALSQGVPTACIGWSHKYDQLFTDFGVPELIISEFNEVAVENKLQYMVSSRRDIERTLTLKKSELSLDIETMWVKIAQKLS